MRVEFRHERKVAMTSSFYRELIPEVFATVGDLLGYHYSIDSQGWMVDYAAPAQYVRPDLPVMMDVLQMHEKETPAERAQKALAAEKYMSPQEALRILLQRW